MPRRGQPLILGAAAVLAAVSLWVALTLPTRTITVPAPDWTAADPTLTGAFHVHTNRSDGGGSVEDVAAAARQTGLAFVIFTDHGDGTRPPDPPVYRDGVLCIDAVEISTRGGHYIALGLPEISYPLAGEASAVVEDVRRFGGFGIVAHPTSDKPDLVWSEWAVPFDGIEWLNGDSQWRDETTPTLLNALLRYPWRPTETLGSLLDRPDTALRQWDEAGLRRPVVGLAGTDAHARLAVTTGEAHDDADEGGLRFPGYRPVLTVSSITVELETPPGGDAAADAHALIAGIRSGRVFSTVDALATPGHFAFEARTAAGRFPMGSRIDVEQMPATLHARASLPDDAEIVLLMDGVPIARRTGEELSHTVEREGAYRVEVRLASAPGSPSTPWIVGNPIYVRRSEPDAPRGQLRPLDTRHLDLDAWAVEHDAGSDAILDHAADRISLEYRMGPGGDAAAALAHPIDPARLDAFEGIAFETRADRPTRALLQVRSTDAGRDLRWQWSFFTGPETTTVTIPFDRLRPVTPDLSIAPIDADMILIGLDGTHTAAGQTGRIAIIAPRLIRTADTRF